MLRVTLCCSLLLVSVPSSPAFAEDKPEAFLETMPAEACASLTVRNLEELDAHYVKHLQKQNNHDASLKQLAQLGLGFLRITQGVDWTGTFSLSLMNTEESRNYDVMLRDLVLRVPFTDAPTMAKNYQLAKEDLVPGKIHEIGMLLNGKQDAYVSFRADHILLSMKREAIEQYLNSAAMSTVVATDPGGRLSGADVLMQVNPRAVDPERYDQLVEKEIDKILAGESDEFRERAKQVMRHLDQAFYSMKIDRGVHVRVHCSLSSKLPDELKEILQTYAHPSAAPDLRGFPRGNLLISLSKAADREQNAVIKNRSIVWLLEQTFRNKSVSNLMRPYLDPRGDTFHGLIDEIWNSNIEARSAVYLNENLKEEGLANLVVILKPEDADGFTDQLSSLVKFSRGAVYNPRTRKAERVTQQEIQNLIAQLGSQEFRERKAATLRLKLLGEPALPLLEQSAESKDVEVARRSKSLLIRIRETAAHHAEVLIKEGLTTLPQPEFVLYENQREIAGYPTDVLAAQWDESDLVTMKKVQELAGPLGHEILIVHVEDEVVLFWGSDRQLLTDCLSLLKSGTPGLNEQRATFAKYAAPRRLIETHLSVQKMARMVPEALGGRLPESEPTEDFSSLGLEISPQHVIGDVYFPLPEFQMIAGYFFLF